MPMRNAHTRMGYAAWFLMGSLVACGRAPESAPAGAATPVYNQQTGRLEQIVSDRDGDGRVETRAFMDGTRLVRIEIDRDGNEKVDRWEHYASAGDPPEAVVERVEEAGGPDGAITRRETYAGGVLERVEEDTNLDGKPDKWEVYRRGHLAHVDLDLESRGSATRRLVYGTDGNIERLEADADGDGVFEPLAAGGGAR
jgi:hypothetical protein